MRGRVLVPVAILALVVLGALWFLSAYERVPGKAWVGASGEARLRPFLAAERFMQRMGLPAAEVRSLPEFDALPPGGVLLLPRGRQAFDAPRISRVLAWVANGGHLVAEAELPGVTDALFDALGVKRAEGKPSPKPLLIEVPGSERKLAVAFHDGLSLAAAAREPRVRGADKIYSFPRGRGMVTAASSLHFARNHLIGQHDHAAFLWALAGLTGAEALHVYWSPRRLSLWGFLTANALPALAAAAALLAAWLWFIAPRFGPVAPDAPPARRRLLDHLRASGRYYWSRGLRPRLVLAARDAALRRLAAAQPDFAAASQKEKISRLASLIHVSHEEAARFLAAAGAMRGADFIRLTQHAQRVHSALEKGDK